MQWFCCLVTCSMSCSLSDLIGPLLASRPRLALRSDLELGRYRYRSAEWANGLRKIKISYKLGKLPLFVCVTVSRLSIRPLVRIRWSRAAEVPTLPIVPHPKCASMSFWRIPCHSQHVIANSIQLPIHRHNLHTTAHYHGNLVCI